MLINFLMRTQQKLQFYIYFAHEIVKKTLQNLDVLAKLQNFSVLPWQPNLPNNKKVHKYQFIWVVIVLGIYNFEAGM